MAVTVAVTNESKRLVALLLLGLTTCADSSSHAEDTDHDGGSEITDAKVATEDAADGSDTGDASATGETDATADDADAGASPRRVFVTSSSHAGDLGGLSGADEHCMARAKEAGLEGDFVAWLSSPEADAKERVSTGKAGAFVRVDGELVAEDLADLVDGELAAPINLDENGEAVRADAWTGTLATGELEPDRHCDGFTSGSASVAGVCGRTSETNGNWSAILTPNCSARLRLYCFER